MVRTCSHCGKEVQHKSTEYSEKAKRKNSKCRYCPKKSKIEITYNKFKRNAKYRSKEFTITLDYVEGLYVGQKMKCYYTGKELTSISFDRVDSKLGYVKGNVVICLPSVNISKNQYDVVDFIQMCKEISYEN